MVDAGVDRTTKVLQALLECLLQSTFLAELETILLQPGFSKLHRCDVDLEVALPISPTFDSLRTWSEAVFSGMPQLSARGVIQ